jgi:wobble nucleotide-excising tRNase
MVTKFVAIRNVGRFENYGAGGDVQLRRYNLFFAPNGRGKTTLCAILRSLQTGQSEFILGRRTLGSAGLPEVN